MLFFSIKAPTPSPSPMPTPKPTPFGYLMYAEFIQQYQTFTVPDGITSLVVTAYGAQGWSTESGSNTGGLGGLMQVVLSVSPGQVLYVYVGGAGSTTTSSDDFGAGWNGGGRGNLI